MSVMTNSNKDLHIVMGISSAGKSTFIKNAMENGVLKNNIPVFMAYEITEGDNNSIHQECIVHYNLFRPYDNSIENIDNEFISDVPLNILFKLKYRTNVTVLLARRSVLAKRILLRREVEPISHRGDAVYPAESIFELLCGIDLVCFYRKWFNLLDELDISYKAVDSESVAYKEFRNSDEAISWLQQKKRVHYTDAEVAEIMDRFKFEHQAVSLPSGDFTSGDDRTDTLKIISKYFSNKTVLDIGCAYGFFCFEAERYNAQRVIGIELKQHRFIGANILKEILGSQCEFIKRDVFEEPLKETFDLVLLLNVLHHLKEPIRALRMVARMAKEVFIIEFPNIKDEKFTSTLDREDLNLRDGLPLIGVSLLGKQDQTFLFNEEAIRRILLDHDSMCSHIDFIQSPMSQDRRIAICHK